MSEMPTTQRSEVISQAELERDPIATLQRIGEAAFALLTRHGQPMQAAFTFNDDVSAAIAERNPRLFTPPTGVRVMTTKDFLRRPTDCLTEIVDGNKELLVVESEPPIAFQALAPTVLQYTLSQLPLPSDTDAATHGISADQIEEAAAARHRALANE